MGYNRKHAVSSAVGLVIALVAVDVVRAATWYSTGNNKFAHDVTAWNSASDGSGAAPAAQPTAGDTDTWVIESTDRIFFFNNPNGVNTWFGGTTIVEAVGANDGEVFARNAHQFMQDVALNGGALNNFTGGSGITGNTLTLNGGALGSEDNEATYNFSTVTGNGDVLVQLRLNGAKDADGIQNTGGTDARVRMGAANDLSTFTGSFTVQATNATGGFFGFAGDVPDPTFDLFIETDATYWLGNNVHVAALTVDGMVFTDGVYGFTDFAGLGKAANFFDASGTIVVGAGITPVVPTPAALPAGIALLVFGAARRRRAA